MNDVSADDAAILLCSLLRFCQFDMHACLVLLPLLVILLQLLFSLCNGAISGFSVVFLI